jgi:hypothetical protein
MINPRTIVIAILGTVLSAAPLISAQDLKPSGSAAIQELALQPQPFLAGFTKPGTVDPQFSGAFYASWLLDHQTRIAWLERR